MGGYKLLPFYIQSEIIYDFTVVFCEKYVDYKSRTRDQMVQAARSGKQNIAEGYLEKSIESKIKLVGVARASLEELLNDYQDYVRQHNLQTWNKDTPQAQIIRALVYKSYNNYKNYNGYIQNPESACNAMICLINQTNQLLDHPSSTLATPVVYVHASWWCDYGARKLRWLEEDFVKNGGFRENLFKKRREYQKNHI